MRAHMDRMMEQMLNGPASFDMEPRVYGVSVHIGPDGQPHVQEYGNFKPPVPEPEAAPYSREPLMDIVEEKDKVRVIMELPGVRNDDITVRRGQGLAGHRGRHGEQEVLEAHRAAIPGEGGQRCLRATRTASWRSHWTGSRPRDGRRRRSWIRVAFPSFLIFIPGFGSGVVRIFVFSQWLYRRTDESSSLCSAMSS